MRSRLWMREGAFAGLIGYAASLALYTVVNLVLDRPPFFAARSFGAEMLGSPAGGVHPLLAIMAYDGVRAAVFIAVGMLMSNGICRIGRRPHLAVGSLAAGVVALVLSEGLLFLLARPVSAVHVGWVVAAANLAGGLAMVVYLVQCLLLRELDAIAKRLL